MNDPQYCPWCGTHNEKVEWAGNDAIAINCLQCKKRTVVDCTEEEEKEYECTKCHVFYREQELMDLSITSGMCPTCGKELDELE